MATNGFSEAERKTPIKFATLLAIASEFMIFAGLASAFIAYRAEMPDWPPLGQPRLPVSSTAINTAFLLLSAFTTRQGLKRVKSGNSAGRWLLASLILGLLFVLLQGREWVDLFSAGLHLENNPYAGFFYLIVGLHAVHVLVAIALCAGVFLRERLGAYKADQMHGLVAFSYFWYFVVFLWPPLYVLVYLW